MYCTLLFAPLAKHYSGDKIKYKGMGGACSTFGGGEVHVRDQWVCLKEIDHWEVLGVGGRSF
jgi:hypothetical protein